MPGLFRSVRALVLLAAMSATAGCGRQTSGAPAPHQLHIAGASAAFPFSSAAAERLMREDATLIAPLVQADGSGPALARFCKGAEDASPDIVVATRTMSAAERTACAHGDGDIAAIPFGWSALVVVTRADTPALALTAANLRAALAGSARDWHAIDRRLPTMPIAIDGPAAARGVEGLDPPASPRRDGRYHSHGYGAPLVLEAVRRAPGAIGLVPWSYAAMPEPGLRLLSVDGIPPDAATIAAGRYPLRQPLILYARAGATAPGLRRLLALYADGWRAGGGFARTGLVPLRPADSAAATRRIARLTGG